MYAEDVRAETDMNVVAAPASGEFIEVQGTAEGAPFRRSELDALLDLAVAGCAQLAEIQARRPRHRTARHRARPVMKQLLLATHNAHKLEELRRILETLRARAA